jgi:hypothetical protein
MIKLKIHTQKTKLPEQFTVLCFGSKQWENLDFEKRINKESRDKNDTYNGILEITDNPKEENHKPIINIQKISSCFE